MTSKLAQLYGSMVFDEATMRERLSPESFGAWKACVTDGKTLDAHTAGEIAEAYLAMDADLFIARQVRAACEEAGVRLVEVANMKQLGQACGVEVKTASAGIRR